MCIKHMCQHVYLCTYSSTISISKHASRTVQCRTLSLTQSMSQWPFDSSVFRAPQSCRRHICPFWLIDWSDKDKDRDIESDFVIQWQIEKLRIRDWQSESDLDSIRNICDVLFERMKIENYFDICKCCDVVLLLSLFLSVSLWLSKLGCCHMKRAVLGFKRLQCPMSSQRAANQLFSLNPQSNVLPAIQYME